MTASSRTHIAGGDHTVSAEAETRAHIAISIVVICKDEPALADTLEGLRQQVDGLPPEIAESIEVLVVDSSTSPPALDAIDIPRLRWIAFTPPPRVRISIPHQRNVGVRAATGDIIVFTDCGCSPARGWLNNLLDPIVHEGERIVCGKTGSTGPRDPYEQTRRQQERSRYLSECPTINVAFRREVFDELEGFDESFEYGSDIDFSWRAVHRGMKIRYAPDAVVLHDWGTRRRQLRRSFAYGKARARLYRKHVMGMSAQSIRKRRLDGRDVVPIAYAIYLVGLPLAIKRPSYLLLPLATAWRARHARPAETVIDHLAYGAGVLAGAYLIARGK